jgi:phosphoribosylformylglycinamidine cyclo-ligase
MAEMNDLYRPGDYDLAGFAVGIIDKDNFIDGSKIGSRQNIYGFTSSGLHSNGYSLARKVLTDKALEENNLSKKDLLAPTKIYVKSILNLLEKNIPITGIAHITGGGLQENLIRSLPENIVAEIKEENIKIPNIFKIIEKVGNISKKEMFRVFNMGIGMVVISPEKLETSADFIYLGETKSGKKEVKLV